VRYRVPLIQPLSTDGAGGGNISMLGDYSDTGVGATEFYIKASGNYAEDCVIRRVLVHITDNNNFSGDGFGGGSALTTGIIMEYRTIDDTMVSTMTPVPIRANHDWSVYCYDVRLENTGTNRSLAARWSFDKFTPDGLWLGAKRKLVVVVNDDLSFLSEFTIVAEGSGGMTHHHYD